MARMEGTMQVAGGYANAMPRQGQKAICVRNDHHTGRWGEGKILGIGMAAGGNAARYCAIGAQNIKKQGKNSEGRHNKRQMDFGHQRGHRTLNSTSLRVHSPLDQDKIGSAQPKNT